MGDSTQGGDGKQNQSWEFLFGFFKKLMKTWWQASLSNWMHGSSKKEIGGKKNPGDQTS